MQKGLDSDINTCKTNPKTTCLVYEPLCCNTFLRGKENPLPFKDFVVIYRGGRHPYFITFSDFHKR